MTLDAAGSGPGLVLASASPRRLQLLGAVGVDARCQPADVDESPRPGELPLAMVERLARAKALAGLALVGASDDVVVIGADTTVDLDGESLGKPGDDAEARAMLRRLSGRSHQVLTGVAVASPGRCASGVDGATVEFRALGEDEIEHYVASGEAQGKAGAYALQGRAGLFVPRIEGSFHTVVGLPLVLLDELCRAVAGRPLLAWAVR